jgi:tetratricopeptide (TPR) repeat protein
MRRDHLRLVIAALLTVVPLAVFGADNAAALVQRAMTLRAAGDLSGAISLLERAVSIAPKPEYELSLAETLAWAKRFPQAEAQYRAVLQRDHNSRAAALGLGQVLLWEHHYAAGAAQYRRVLSAHPGDVDAQRGLAFADYWSGDYRRAQRELQALLRSRPNDAEVRKALADIGYGSRPVAATDGSVVNDDQPFRRAMATATYTAFSDPLTKWTATAGTYAVAAQRLGFGSATAPFAGVGGDAKFPASQLRAAVSIRLLRFPDGVTQPLGNVALSREWNNNAVRAAVDRSELLYTATSMLSHPCATTATLGWSRSTDAASSAAAVHATRYFDGNHGRAADAYHLFRVAHSRSASLMMGGAASYRDSDETRFRLVGASATRTANGYDYAYTAQYDPYWTPQQLAEVRAIVAASVVAGRTTFHLRADGGIGRDRDLQFGSSSGASASVPVFVTPATVMRTFHPWRVSADAVIPTRGSMSFTAGFEHQVTVFYTANTFHFGLSGRL